MVPLIPTIFQAHKTQEKNVVYFQNKIGLTTIFSFDAYNGTHEGETQSFYGHM